MSNAIFLNNVSLDMINKILSGRLSKNVRVEVDELTFPRALDDVQDDGSIICGWSKEGSYEIPSKGPCMGCCHYIKKDAVGVPIKTENLFYSIEGRTYMTTFVHAEGRYCHIKCVYRYLLTLKVDGEEELSRLNSLKLLKIINGRRYPGTVLVEYPSPLLLESNGGNMSRKQWVGKSAAQTVRTSDVRFLPISRRYILNIE